MKRSQGAKAAAWRDLALNFLMIWLPRIHLIRMERRLKRLAELERRLSQA